MKIALIGYGKMGKAIEEIALSRGHEICLKVDSSNKDAFSAQSLESCDVAIEFTVPASVKANVLKCAEAKVPVVVGTTAWYDDYDLLTSEIKAAGTALLAATNFSVGVNIFFELNRKLAQLMSSQSDYKAGMTEIHHTQKLDAPSGTAISLAEGLIEEHPSYSKWENEATSNETSLPIISEREENVPGTHIVKYSSEIDEIEISHLAKNRKGFALGAVIAAEFLHDKEGIFSMKDVLNF